MSENEIEISEEVKHRHTVKAADARAQASEGKWGFLRSEFRQAANGEVFEIPHKDLFDLDQQERWDDLQDEMRRYEREPDVLAANGTLIAKGQLVYPHRWAEAGEFRGVKVKKGDRVKPSYPERLAIVLWGEEGAARAKAGGILFNEIEIVWAKQFEEMRERQQADPKS